MSQGVRPAPTPALKPSSASPVRSGPLPYRQAERPPRVQVQRWTEVDNTLPGSNVVASPQNPRAICERAEARPLSAVGCGSVAGKCGEDDRNVRLIQRGQHGRFVVVLAVATARVRLRRAAESSS